MVILFQSTCLRMSKQCWQSVVEHTLFLLWGFVKDKVYRTSVRDLADLQEIIYAAVNNVTPQALHNTWVKVEYWLDIAHGNSGSHVEVYEA